MNEASCFDLASACRVAHLATVRPDGRPDIVPIVFAFLHGSLVFAVDHKPKSTRDLQRLQNVDHQPDVTVLFDHYDDANWSNLWWVRMRGTATELPVDSVESEQALDALQSRYTQHASHRPPGPVVQITPTQWTGWTGTED